MDQPLVITFKFLFEMKVQMKVRQTTCRMISVQMERGQMEVNVPNKET